MPLNYHEPCASRRPGAAVARWVRIGNWSVPLADFHGRFKGLSPGGGECRPNPFFDSLRMDVDPIIGPVNGFGIPVDALQIFSCEHTRRFSNVARLEGKAGVQDEWEE